MRATLGIALLANFVAGSFIGCAGPAEGDSACADGKCDEDEVSACDTQHKIRDLSGGEPRTNLASSLNDGFAKSVMRRGGSCPTTFEDIVTKLKQVVPDSSCGNQRLRTSFISETAQLAQTPDVSRVITTHDCADTENEIHFALAGVRVEATALPREAEIIAFDAAAGVFNFYAVDGNEVAFFGNSKDLLNGSPDGQTRRCARCHNGGGLVMREQELPNLHWEWLEASKLIPGAAELTSAHGELLGEQTSGHRVQGSVENGNERWLGTKITYLTTREQRSIQQLLRPLFCTVEINIATGDHGGDNQFIQVDREALVDPGLTEFGVTPITEADYDALIRSNGQQIRNSHGEQVGTHIDTVVKHAYVRRSAIDVEYVNKLRSRIVDANFVKDVLMVDFTRPVFSTDRCKLLAFAPAIAGEITPTKIREGFIANLAAKPPAAGTPEAALLASLKNQSDDFSHNAKLEGFFQACTNLGSAGFLKNLLAITSLNRNKARELPIIRAAETLPFDNQNVDANARLHPATCELVNRFVAP